MGRTVGGEMCLVGTCHRRLRIDFVTALRTAAESSQSCHEQVLSARISRRTVTAMSTDLRHRLGRAGENVALRHLERCGYELVARNHRTRFGEIDLIVTDGRTLVFCEVKTRRAGGGSPWDALREPKQRQVRQMAIAYLNEVAGRPPAGDLRFDAIGVVFDARGRLARLDHIEAAF
jgi:putative endonuclease